MVAYSFKTHFAPDIQSGAKTHTIRGPRKRHARVGEPVQLYCKMRRPDCFKVIPDPICTFVEPITITMTKREIREIVLGEAVCRVVEPTKFDAFARLDGFANINEMAAFWAAKLQPAEAGCTHHRFAEWIIGWGKHPLEVLYG